MKIKIINLFDTNKEFKIKINDILDFDEINKKINENPKYHFEILHSIMNDNLNDNLKKESTFNEVSLKNKIIELINNEEIFLCHTKPSNMGKVRNFLNILTFYLIILSIYLFYL
jgi:hypothetical protein